MVKGFCARVRFILAVSRTLSPHFVSVYDILLATKVKVDKRLEQVIKFGANI